MIKDLTKAPFPWFGGKSQAAPAVWAALGDVTHYVEPFAGSLAVLLRRPHPCNRPYYSETVNDMDGLLVNFWRAVAADPEAVAHHASWPVSEADLHARHVALLRWKSDQPLERLMGDPDFHDARIAGWWVWGQSSWIGSGWCSGQGPWTVGADGVFYRRARAASTREPGVWRQLPHIGNNGKGVNHAGTREPGVSRQLPHLGNDGMGVNHAGTREPGVGEPYHPMTMPDLVRWIAFLGARLRHVRILHGDWARACTDGAALSLSVRQGKSPAGVFLDPPYSGDVRAGGVYSHDDHGVASEVRAWCASKGPDPRYRIVLAGFSGEGHESLATEHGWREVEWYAGGFLRGGMANQSKTGTNQKRERLWISPYCLGGEAAEPVAEGDETETETETESENKPAAAADTERQLGLWGAE
jgi:DNA adenine methylase